MLKLVDPAKLNREASARADAARLIKKHGGIQAALLHCDKMIHRETDRRWRRYLKLVRKILPS
jgi:hypothetical protein